MFSLFNPASLSNIANSALPQDDTFHAPITRATLKEGTILFGLAAISTTVTFFTLYGFPLPHTPQPFETLPPPIFFVSVNSGISLPIFDKISQ